jgi:hypothetical protein
LREQEEENVGYKKSKEKGANFRSVEMIFKF